MNKTYITIILLVLGFRLFAVDLSYDISLLPEDNGSGTITSFRLGFNKGFSSRINFKESQSNLTTTTIQGYGPDSLQNSNSASLQIDLLPLEFELNTQSISGTISFGFSYLEIEEKQHAVFDDVNGYLEIPAGQLIAYRNLRKAQLYSPRIGLELQYMPFKDLYVHYGGFISPVYLLFLNQEMHYSIITDQATNSLQRWSSPYLEHSLSIQYKNWIRIAMYHTYQRLDFQTMDWDNTGSYLKANDDIQENQEIRIGIEPLLSFNGGMTSFKLGFYWKAIGFKSSYWGIEANRTQFSVAFGTEG